jgi:hypothetical protein
MVHMSRPSEYTSQPDSRSPDSCARSAQAVMTGFTGWLGGREIPAGQCASIRRAVSGFLRWAFQHHPASDPFHLQRQIELHAGDYWGSMRAGQRRASPGMAMALHPNQPRPPHPGHHRPITPDRTSPAIAAAHNRHKDRNVPKLSV